MTDTISSIPQNATIPLSELMRARISDNPIAMPVQGGIYARLSHITAVPANTGSGGYSLVRLRAIDSLIARMAQMQANAPELGEYDLLERQQQLIDETARRVVDDIDRSEAQAQLNAGLLVDVFV